jgi:hypothetical protein
MTVTVVIVGFRAYAELAPLLSILEHDPSSRRCRRARPRVRRFYVGVCTPLPNATTGLARCTCCSSRIASGNPDIATVRVPSDTVERFVLSMRFTSLARGSLPSHRVR